MIRALRTTASVVVAVMTALTMTFWIMAPGHDDPRLGHQLAATFDTAVGLIDLHVRNDHRGYQRLIDLDPSLSGVGGQAAENVVASDAFTLDERLAAAGLLANRRGTLDETLTAELVDDLENYELLAFRGLDPGLDRAIDQRLSGD